MFEKSNQNAGELTLLEKSNQKKWHSVKRPSTSLGPQCYAMQVDDDNRRQR